MSQYTISTAPDVTGIAPKDHRWSAWFNDMDEGVMCGHGETEAAAIADLIANYDTPWGAA